MTKDGVEKSGQSKPLSREQASKARGGLAIVNYMAQGRPDLAVMARVLSQRSAPPTEGTEDCVQRIIRYLVAPPLGVLAHPHGFTDGS